MCFHASSISLFFCFLTSADFRRTQEISSSQWKHQRRIHVFIVKFKWFDCYFSQRRINQSPRIFGFIQKWFVARAQLLKLLVFSFYLRYTNHDTVDKNLSAVERMHGLDLVPVFLKTN